MKPTKALPKEITIALCDKEIQEYLQRVPVEKLHSEAVSLLRIGIMCVNRVSASSELDYWDKRTQQLQSEVSALMVDIVEKKLLSGIVKLVGTKDGQLLSPIASQVDATSKFIDQSLSSNESRIKSMVADMAKSLSSGSLKESFGQIITRELLPLTSEVRALSNEIMVRKGENSIKQSSSLKGVEYEQCILERVQIWARCNKFKVENVGVDNKAGDIIVESASEKIRIAIEVKDSARPKGHQVLTVEMGKVIQARKATIAVFLSKTMSGLAKEIGSYGEGISDDIKWVATTGDSLEVALNHCLVEERLRLSSGRKSVATNGKKIRENLELARVLLGSMSQHYRSITEIQKAATTLEASLRNTNSDVLRALSAAADLITLDN